MTIREETLLLDEIKLDLKTMDQEKEALSHRIDKAERRVQSLPQLEKYMTSATALRVEKERIAELEIQRQRERDSVGWTKGRQWKKNLADPFGTESPEDEEPTERVEGSRGEH